MTKRLTSLLTTSTFIIAASGSAFAADIAVKAPLPSPAPVIAGPVGTSAAISVPALAMLRPTSTPLLLG
jgi:hypothetical protein